MIRSMRAVTRGGLSVLLSFILLSFGSHALASERMGEHPKKEHPEAKSGKEGSGITKENLAAAIRRYVEESARDKGGRYMIYDEKTGKPLFLTLDKVHEDRLSQVGPGAYFACADFTAEDGSTYDLDIFMTGPDSASLRVIEVSIHKENGVERYTWREDGGIWKRSETGKGGEHPKEHPAMKGSSPQSQPGNP